MKRIFLALILLVCLVAPAHARYQDWWQIASAAADAGGASFTVPVVASGSMKVDSYTVYHTGNLGVLGVVASDSDKLDGYHASTTAAVNTVVVRDASGNIAATTASTTGNATVGGTLGVTGKTTTGTLESGAATFTGNIYSSAGTLGQSISTLLSTGVYIHGSPSFATFGANAYYTGSAYAKYRTASSSAMLRLNDVNKTVDLYLSDAGNSSVTQNGPYTVWHGGMTTFETSGFHCYPDTPDGSDTSYSWLSGGGGAAATRGGYLKLHGNEHATDAGKVYLISGSVGNIGLYTGSGVERFRINSDGTASFSENVYFAKDVSALTFTDRSDSPETLEDAKAIVMSHETIPGESRIDHSKLSPLAFGRKEYQVPTGRTIEVQPSLEAVQEYQSKLAAFEQAEAGVPPEGEPVAGKSMAAPLEEPEAPKVELVPEMETVVEPDRTKRNLSMVVSAQALVIKDLLKRVEALEKRTPPEFMK